MPPATDLTQKKLSCCVCEKDLESISTLHHHQMDQHTVEELSMALLSLRGLQLVTEVHKAIEEEKCPNLIQDSKQSSAVLSLNSTKPFKLQSTSIETSIPVPVVEIFTKDTPKKMLLDTHKLQGASSFPGEISIPTPIVELSRTDLASSLHVISNTTKATVLNNHQSNKFTPYDQNSRKYMKQLKCMEKEMHKSYLNNLYNNSLEMQTTPCTGVNTITHNDSETDTDIEIVHWDEEYQSSLKGKSTILPKIHDSQTSLTLGSSLEKNKCTNHLKCNESEKEHFYSITETDSYEKLNDKDKVSCNEEEGLDSCKECTSSYSVESCLSPDNSPNPRQYIQAIITRLPHIVPPDVPQHFKQGRRSRRMKQKRPQKYVNDSYVMPSPVDQHHRSSLMYDYSNSARATENEMNSVTCSEFDYFIPKLESKDKVNGSRISSDGPECKGHPSEESLPSYSKYTEYKKSKKKKLSIGVQVVQLSTTVQKLAAIRKITNKTEHKICTIKTDSKDNKILGIKREAFAPISTGTSENVATPSTSLYSPCDLPSNCTINKINKSVLIGTNISGLMKIYPPGTTDRRFFCEPCGKSYKKKSHLERHLRVHTGERPFPCSHCDKRFAVHSILKQHIRIHTGEKPYWCSICFQRFPQKSGLMTHMMLHTGKPFKCSHCEKAFVSNHKLIQHLRSNHSEEHHICRDCNVDFLTDTALFEHAHIHNQNKLHAENTSNI